jgi:hypothetical protein
LKLWAELYAKTSFTQFSILCQVDASQASRYSAANGDEAYTCAKAENGATRRALRGAY